MAQSLTLTLRPVGFDLAALRRHRKVSLEDRVFAPLTDRGVAPVQFVGKIPLSTAFNAATTSVFSPDSGGIWSAVITPASIASR